MPVTATIKAVDDDPNAENNILVSVDFNNGKEVITKVFRYTNTNLESKQQVLDMIQGELKVFTGFKAIVEDLKTEIDKPIEATAVIELAEPITPDKG